MKLQPTVDQLNLFSLPIRPPYFINTADSMTIFSKDFTVSPPLRCKILNESSMNHWEIILQIVINAHTHEINLHKNIRKFPARVWLWKNIRFANRTIFHNKALSRLAHRKITDTRKFISLNPSSVSLNLSRDTNKGALLVNILCFFEPCVE